jgi:hypothetical protein
MRINIQPGFHRALQTARREEIARAAARQRATHHDRSGWVVRSRRAVIGRGATSPLRSTDAARIDTSLAVADLPDLVEI